MFSASIGFWQLGESYYWGHNAILRVDAFLKHCGLPRLPGQPPLGGEVLSHDFVEAALMGRAGWEVWLADDLPGSYEESPPSLLDELKRDRRWCQGNLQHLRALGRRYSFWPSRHHCFFPLPYRSIQAASVSAGPFASGGCSWSRRNFFSQKCLNDCANPWNSAAGIGARTTDSSVQSTILSQTPCTSLCYAVKVQDRLRPEHVIVICGERRWLKVREVSANPIKLSYFATQKAWPLSTSRCGRFEIPAWPNNGELSLSIEIFFSDYPASPWLPATS